MILSALLFFLCLPCRAQQVSWVEFGPCLRPGCQLVEFMAGDLRLDVTDSLIKVNDARGSVFRRLGPFLTRRSGGQATRCSFYMNGGSRVCLVSLVEDGALADNRVVVAYAGTVTVYHLRIFIARP